MTADWIVCASPAPQNGAMRIAPPKPSRPGSRALGRAHARQVAHALVAGRWRRAGRRRHSRARRRGADCSIDPFDKDFCPAPAMEASLSVRRRLAPGGPTVAGCPRESTPGRVPSSRAWIPAQEALERRTGDPLLAALVQASTGHNAARRPPRPGWSASELRPAPSCMSASAVAAAGPPDGLQSLPSVCCRGRARDSCRRAE